MKESYDAGGGDRLKPGEDRRAETFEDKMAEKIEKNKITPESLDKEDPAYTEDEVGDRRAPPGETVTLGPVHCEQGLFFWKGALEG